jgi:hypothetical protein
LKLELSTSDYEVSEELADHHSLQSQTEGSDFIQALPRGLQKHNLELSKLMVRVADGTSIIGFTNGMYISVSESRNSLVGIATGYGLDERMIGFRFPAGAGNFSLTPCPDRLWGPPSLIQWVSGSLQFTIFCPPISYPKPKD